MAYTIVGNSPHSVTLDEWYKQTADQNVEYKLHEPQSTAITFNTGMDEMIRVDKDGFYVRGVRVPVDDKEAETVYNAFKQWLVWANLQQQR
jgi:hypothetical protein